MAADVGRPVATSRQAAALLGLSLLFEVPNGLAPKDAALTEPFSVGAHAVARANVPKDSVVMVVGCGPIGLAVIAALKARGIGPVIGMDYSPA
ncbi:MAG: hypothetical protein ABW049_05510 [Spongiibacteraceae bacterium]